MGVMTPFDQAVKTLAKCLQTFRKNPADGIAVLGLIRAITTVDTELRNCRFPNNGQGPKLILLLQEAINVLLKDGSMSQVAELANGSLQILEATG